MMRVLRISTRAEDSGLTGYDPALVNKRNLSCIETLRSSYQSTRRYNPEEWNSSNRSCYATLLKKDCLFGVYEPAFGGGVD